MQQVLQYKRELLECGERHRDVYRKVWSNAAEIVAHIQKCLIKEFDKYYDQDEISGLEDQALELIFHSQELWLTNQAVCIELALK